MTSPKQNVWFVSGIDTDAGKTVATGWLARRWMDEGFTVATVKLVQTGAPDGRSPDIAVHRRIMGVTLPEDAEGLTAPALFDYPASPHLAAAMEKRTLDLQAVLRAIETVSERYDRVLVEGAGGLMVPLTEDLLTIEFAARQHWPVVFVTSGRLGSINHTLLALEAMAARGMRLSHLVWNEHHPSPDAAIDADTYRYLDAWRAKHWPETGMLRCPAIGL